MPVAPQPVVPESSTPVPATTTPQASDPEPATVDPPTGSATAKSDQSHAESNSIQHTPTPHQPSTVFGDHTTQNALQLATLQAQIKQFEAESVEERKGLQAELEKYRQLTRCWESEREQLKQQQAEREAQHERQAAALQVQYERQQAELQVLQTKLEYSQKELERNKRTASDAAGDQHGDQCEAPADKRRRVLREFDELDFAGGYLADACEAFESVFADLGISHVFLCQGVIAQDADISWNLVDRQQMANKKGPTKRKSQITFEFAAMDPESLSDALFGFGGHEESQ